MIKQIAGIIIMSAPAEESNPKLPITPDRKNPAAVNATINKLMIVIRILINVFTVFPNIYLISS